MTRLDLDSGVLDLDGNSISANLDRLSVKRGVDLPYFVQVSEQNPETTRRRGLIPRGDMVKLTRLGRSILGGLGNNDASGRASMRHDPAKDLRVFTANLPKHLDVGDVIKHAAPLLWFLFRSGKGASHH